jgi:hypothetical protein
MSPDFSFERFEVDNFCSTCSRFYRSFTHAIASLIGNA